MKDNIWMWLSEDCQYLWCLENSMWNFILVVTDLKTGIAREIELESWIRAMATVYGELQEAIKNEDLHKYISDRNKHQLEDSSVKFEDKASAMNMLRELALTYNDKISYEIKLQDILKAIYNALNKE